MYILDTSTIMDILRKRDVVRKRFQYALLQGEFLGMMWPIYYEVRRGLFKNDSTGQSSRFEQTIIPVVRFIPLIDADWEQAAQLWAQLQRAGRTLSDIDILIAAATLRVGATLVSADEDFVAISALKVLNWREPFSL